jgi:hypothetical protein
VAEGDCSVLLEKEKSVLRRSLLTDKMEGGIAMLGIALNGLKLNKLYQVNVLILS